MGIRISSLWSCLSLVVNPFVVCLFVRMRLWTERPPLKNCLSGRVYLWVSRGDIRGRQNDTYDRSNCGIFLTNVMFHGIIKLGNVTDVYHMPFESCVCHSFEFFILKYSIEFLNFFFLNTFLCNL